MQRSSAANVILRKKNSKEKRTPEEIKIAETGEEKSPFIMQNVWYT